MMNDVFNSDLFSLTSLTAAIQETPYTPTLISSLGIFEEEGISTLSALLEFEKGTISIVPVAPRNAPGASQTHDKRRTYSIMVPHLPQADALLADQVQGVRAFGSESTTETIEARRDKVLAKMRRQIDYTIEYHRMLALKGTYVDSNGALIDLFGLFGVSQAVVAMLLTTSTTKIRQKCLDIIVAIEAALDGVPYTGITAICGANFWKEFIDHPSVRDTYLNWQAAAELRGAPISAFEYGGIMWRRYRGNSQIAVATDEAIAMPTGVPEMYLTRFAPANYVETVNTTGLPYYAKAEPMKFGKGYDLEAQSNPLNFVSRPGALIKLTKT